LVRRNTEPGRVSRRKSEVVQSGAFKKAPHACAIALIGSGRAIDGVAVGLGKQFVAAHAGALRVGLNDEDLSNEGQVSFQVARRAPTPRSGELGGAGDELGRLSG
jgi:hypothetical protein